jgi:hypothetical protein
VSPCRRDLLLALAGAVFGAGATFAWSVDFAPMPAAVVLGAALGASRRAPVASGLFAVALVVVTGTLGAVPGGDNVTASALLAAHAFAAGRWDPRWLAVPALLAGTGLGMLLAEDVAGFFLFAVPAAWGGGRTLREREQLAAQLEQRAGELEDEREAFAAFGALRAGEDRL